MNKQFTDDKYLKLIEPSIINNILKFYQSTVRTIELENKWNKYKNYTLKIKNPDNYYDIPESYIEAIPIYKLSYIEKEIINKMEEFLKSQDYIYFLPIFTVNKSENIKSGIYSIDFINGFLYKFKELSMTIINKYLFKENFDMCISYFLDISKCAFLDRELGFINGIIQIGRVYENIEQVALKNSISVFTKFTPQQSFTHNLGINCREQLLIKNQILRGI